MGRAYVCLCVCVRVLCTCVYVHARLFQRAHVCIYVCVCLRGLCAQVRACARACVSSPTRARLCVERGTTEYNVKLYSSDNFGCYCLLTEGTLNLGVPFTKWSAVVPFRQDVNQ